MGVLEDPIEVGVEDVAVETELQDFSLLRSKPMASAPATVPASAVTARLHGFGSDDHPLLVDLWGLPGEIVAARTTVPLRLEQSGATVVVVFEQNDVRRPIVIGVIEERLGLANSTGAPPPVSVRADDQQVTVSAEREIVLQCGRASITLTRAGKIIIKGSHIVSQSTGYNRIKGAAVDIN